MKSLRIGFIVFAAALITFGLSGMAFAFHSGGVAECTGCHALHDAASGSSLLVNTDASSTCLTAMERPAHPATTSRHLTRICRLASLRETGPPAAISGG